MRIKIAVIVLMIVALVGAGVALFVKLPAGQAFLTGQITRAISGSGQTITVQRIGGDWPSHIIWGGINVADRDGVWLRIDRLELRLRPGALALGRIVVDTVQAGTVDMLRTPVGEPDAAPSPPPSIESLTASLSRITIREARVGVLRLDPAVMGGDIDATVTAALQGDAASGLHTLTIATRLRDGEGALDLKLAAGRNAAVLQVNGAAENFTAIGAITINNRSNALSGALRLGCATTPCFAWSDGQIGPVAADMAVTGTVAAPEGRLDVRVQDAAFGTRSLPLVEGRFVVLPKKDAPAGTIAITGAGTAAGVSAAFPEGLPLLAETGRWSFGMTREEDGALTLDSALIESGDAVAEVEALMLTPDFSPATVKLSLRGAARFLGREDATSHTAAELRIDRMEAGGIGAGRLSATVTDLPPSAAIAPVLQGRLTLSADVTVDLNQVVIANIVAQSAGASVRGASTWTRAPQFDHQVSKLTVTLPAFAILPEPTQADVSLAGPLAAIQAEASATVPVVLLSDAPVRDLVLTAALDRAAAAFTVDVRGNGQWIDGPLALSATVAQHDSGLIEIGALTWASPTVNLSGELAFNPETTTLDGEIRGPISDLAPLTMVFGVESTGSGDVRLTFGEQQGMQRLDVAILAADVQNSALTAERMTFNGRFDDLFNEMAMTTQVEAAGARLFDRPLASFAARANGSLEALKVEMEAKGAADTPFSVASAADIAFGDATTITLQRLAAQDGDLKATLVSPAELALRPDSMALAPTRIAVQTGDAPPGELTVGFSWMRASDVFEAQIAARDVAVPTFATLLGQSTAIVLNGEASLQGSLESVDVNARLTGRLPGANGQAPIDIAASVVMADGRAVLEATATGLSAEPAHLNADLPARLNLSSARLAFAADAPVSGTLRWNGNLAPLWRLVPVDMNVLAGDVVVDVALSGTFAAPRLTGDARLTNGTYENLIGGTALRNIEAAIGGDGQGGFTLSLTAQDMNDGTVTLSGRIAGGPEMMTDVTAQLTRLDVLHRDDVVAAATGTMNYAGPLGAGAFKGDLQIVNSLVRLGGSYMPEIPLLRALPGFETRQNDELFAGITLQVGVTTAGPMRIEGEGLDSLWRGQFTVAGSLARPDVRGTLTLDRGTFSFLSQAFTLSSGTITFIGGETVDPQLNIVAVREAPDVTATVNITGRARAPEVQLSSQPALPRDEVLARLLFRKGTGELGPIESIQLASAASDLAGISRGGINGVLRRTFGVDLSSGSSGNSVMLGRQLGQNLYVSLGQSLIDQEREIIVEWRISRSFSLKSTTSDVTGADIGVFWRKDY